MWSSFHSAIRVISDGKRFISCWNKFITTIKTVLFTWDFLLVCTLCEKKPYFILQSFLPSNNKNHKTSFPLKNKLDSQTSSSSCVARKANIPIKFCIMRKRLHVLLRWITIFFFLKKTSNEVVWYISSRISILCMHMGQKKTTNKNCICMLGRTVDKLVYSLVSPLQIFVIKSFILKVCFVS